MATSEQGKESGIGKGAQEKVVEENPDQHFIRILTECHDNISRGLATPGILEPEWSRQDRQLVTSIELVLVNFRRRQESMKSEDTPPA